MKFHRFLWIGGGLMNLVLCICGPWEVARFTTVVVCTGLLGIDPHIRRWMDRETVAPFTHCFETHPPKAYQWSLNK